MMNHSIFKAMLACLCIAIAPSAYAKEFPSVVVTEGWSVPTFKNAKAGVAYVTITNNSTQDDVLLSASSPVADMVETHGHRMDGDIIRMHKLNEVPLPAGQAISFGPGKLHLMLMQLKQPLVKGQIFPVTLKFKHGKPVTVDVVVKDRQEQMNKGMQH